MISVRTPPGAEEGCNLSTAFYRLAVPRYIKDVPKITRLLSVMVVVSESASGPRVSDCIPIPYRP